MFDDLHHRPRDEYLFRCPAPGCDAKFLTRGLFARHVLQTSHCTKLHRNDNDDVPVLHVPDFLVDDITSAEENHFIVRPITAISDARERGTVMPCVDHHRFRNTRYRCRDCELVTFTWDQLESHMQAERHCIMQCADCDEQLSWDPQSKYAPMAHAKQHASLAASSAATDDADADRSAAVRQPMHTGIRGVYRCIENFEVSADEVHFPKQFPLGFGRSMVVYTHKVFHAYAAALAGSPQAQGLTATCINCRECRNQPLYDACLHMLATNHLDFVVKYYPQPLAAIPQELRAPPPPPVLRFQCPTCFALRETWAELLEHMAWLWHGSVACTGCGERIPAPDIEAHFRRSACAGVGSHCGGSIPSPQNCVVAVDLTDLRLVELLGESDELVDPCYAQDLSCRVVYQCPLETCLRAFENESVMKAHLHVAKHGVYTCPADHCGKQLCVWEDAFRDHEHPIELPSNGHLAGKTKMSDFFVMFNDRDLQRMFPNYFAICADCDMILDATDPEAKKRHFKRECDLRREMPRLNIRETIEDLHARSSRVSLPVDAVRNFLEKQQGR